MRIIWPMALRVGVTALAAVMTGGLVAAPAQAAASDDVTPQIVGGTLAAKGEFPWMVRLSMGCGGTMYTSSLVLTAAHCVGSTGVNTSITATWGVADLQDPTAITRTSNYVYRAPEHDGTGSGSDWALIRLSNPIASPLMQIATNTLLHSGTLRWPAGAPRPKAEHSNATCARPACRSSATPPARISAAAGATPGTYAWPLPVSGHS